MLIEERRVFFPAGPYILEASLAQLEGVAPRKAVVICHPHPQYGGDMNNNVVGAVARELAGCGMRVLRFNFRGVGGSQGSYGEGVGELEDVRGAIDFLVQAGDSEELYLVGYSFGALVGLRVATADKRLQGWVGIAPPVGIYDLSFLEGCPRPKLLVAGDRDPFCPVPALENLFAQLSEPKTLALIPGADHFLVGDEDRLALEVKSFLSSVPHLSWPTTGY